jgi:tetratricopeptide (TPR) repeat protein
MKTQPETTIEEGLNALQGQQYSKAESLFRQALQTAQEAEDDLMMAKCLDNIAEVSFQQGWFEQAEPYFEQALEIRRKKLPTGHEDIIASLNNLSATYFFQRKYRQAKPLCEQLISTYEIVLGKEHPEVATCLINLGLIAMAEGKLDNAEQRFSEATSIRQSNYEPMDILVGNSLSHLGNAYFEQKQYEQASEKFKEALVILEAHHTLDNADLQAVVGKLVHSLEETAKFSELEQLYPRLINSTEIKFGPAHPEVTKYLEKLAHLHLKQTKHEEAEKIFQRLLSMKRRALGDIHPEVANQLTNLAFVKQASRNTSQAETLFLQALNVHESYKNKGATSLAPAFPQYLEAIKNLAIFYDSDKRYAKSEKQWQQLIQLIEPQSKNYPKLLLEAYERFAKTLIEQKKSVQAQTLLEKAIRFLDENRDNTKLDKAEFKLGRARLVTDLANALKLENKYTEAEKHYKSALESLMKSLGPDHSDLVPTLEGYADLLMLTYREQEAEHMLSCARSLKKE